MLVRPAPKEASAALWSLRRAHPRSEAHIVDAEIAGPEYDSRFFLAMRHPRYNAKRQHDTPYDAPQPAFASGVPGAGMKPHRTAAAHEPLDVFESEITNAVHKRRCKPNMKNALSR